MKYFRKIVKIFPISIDLKPYKQPMLGRWKIHDNKLENMKVDMTNEDHCGVCDKMRYDYIDKSSKVTLIKSI